MEPYQEEHPQKCCTYGNGERDGLETNKDQHRVEDVDVWNNESGKGQFNRGPSCFHRVGTGDTGTGIGCKGNRGAKVGSYAKESTNYRPHWCNPNCRRTGAAMFCNDEIGSLGNPVQKDKETIVRRRENKTLLRQV